jgi:hypothetical protein
MCWNMVGNDANKLVLQRGFAFDPSTAFMLLSRIDAADYDDCHKQIEWVISHVKINGVGFALYEKYGFRCEQKIALLEFDPSLPMFEDVQPYIRAKQILALIVGMCDDFLVLTDLYARPLQFFALTSRLPLELQTLIALRGQDLTGVTLRFSMRLFVQIVRDHV